MGCSKSSSKREVYSNTILPQETRKTSNRQLIFAPKTTGKRRKKISKRNEIIKIPGEINVKKKMKETIGKINITENRFCEKINKIDLFQHESSRKKGGESNNKIRNEIGEVTRDNVEI